MLHLINTQQGYNIPVHTAAIIRSVTGSSLHSPLRETRADDVAANLGKIRVSSRAGGARSFWHWWARGRRVAALGTPQPDTDAHLLEVRLLHELPIVSARGVSSRCLLARRAKRTMTDLEVGSSTPCCPAACACQGREANRHAVCQNEQCPYGPMGSSPQVQLQLAVPWLRWFSCLLDVPPLNRLAACCSFRALQRRSAPCQVRQGQRLQLPQPVAPHRWGAERTEQLRLGLALSCDVRLVLPVLQARAPAVASRMLHPSLLHSNEQVSSEVRPFAEMNLVTGCLVHDCLRCPASTCHPLCCTSPWASALVACFARAFG